MNKFTEIMDPIMGIMSLLGLVLVLCHFKTRKNGQLDRRFKNQKISFKQILIGLILLFISGFYMYFTK